MPSRDRRRAAQEWGHRAETLSAWILRVKGYRILGRRVKTAAGEIDLVARRGRVLAFVEVKARRDMDQALHALGMIQRRRIQRAAGIWLARHPEFAALQWRFDVMLVVPGHLPRHLPDAWRDDGHVV